MDNLTDQIINLITESDEWLSAFQIARQLDTYPGTVAMLANQAVADSRLCSHGVGTPEQPYLVYSVA